LSARRQADGGRIRVEPAARGLFNPTHQTAVVFENPLFIQFVNIQA
jgi:hypothetical protein